MREPLPDLLRVYHTLYHLQKMPTRLSWQYQGWAVRPVHQKALRSLKKALRNVKKCSFCYNAKKCSKKPFGSSKNSLFRPNIKNALRSLKKPFGSSKNTHFCYNSKKCSKKPYGSSKKAFLCSNRKKTKNHKSAQKSSTVSLKTHF